MVSACSCMTLTPPPHPTSLILNWHNLVYCTRADDEKQSNPFQMFQPMAPFFNWKSKTTGVISYHSYCCISTPWCSQLVVKIYSCLWPKSILLTSWVLHGLKKTPTNQCTALQLNLCFLQTVFTYWNNQQNKTCLTVAPWKECCCVLALLYVIENRLYILWLVLRFQTSAWT